MKLIFPLIIMLHMLFSCYSKALSLNPIGGTAWLVSSSIKNNQYIKGITVRFSSSTIIFSACSNNVSGGYTFSAGNKFESQKNWKITEGECSNNADKDLGALFDSSSRFAIQKGGVYLNFFNADGTCILKLHSLVF